MDNLYLDFNVRVNFVLFHNARCGNLDKNLMGYFRLILLTEIDLIVIILNDY